MVLPLLFKMLKSRAKEIISLNQNDVNFIGHNMVQYGVGVVH